ncbi:MAG TPA: hypothetical protein DCP91_03675, partial [Eggerthellaceae bacterium]|nr:hypothetical protein [Eggerthellaceae bacterium]
MDASKRSPFQRVMTTLLSVVLVLGLTPAGAWAAPANTGGGGDTSQTGQTLVTTGIDLQTQAEGEWTGTGSETDPYVISDAAGLQKLATDVNSGTAYADTYFKLGTDIDLSGIANWTPIGYNTNNTARDAKSFKGTFDGDGHTILSMTITGRPESLPSAMTFGLFGAAQGTLKDFVVKGDINTGTTITSGDVYLSGVVAQGTASTLAIENVGSEVSITGYGKYVGGFIGRSSSLNFSIKGCYNKGDISITSTAARVGGFVGEGGLAGSSITACYNAGDISLDANNYNLGRERCVAGFVANSTAAYPIKSCFNFGKLSYKYDGTSTNYGAMVGFTNNHWYDNSDNYYLSHNMFNTYSDPAVEQTDRAIGGTSYSFQTATAVDAATLKSAETLAALNNTEYEAGKGYFQTGADYPLLYWEQAGNPTITTQPQGFKLTQGASGQALTVEAALPESGMTGSNGTLSYQWYSCEHDADVSTATAIENATSASYMPNVSEVGVTDYYCIVTNTFTPEGAIEALTPTTTSEVAVVNVQDNNDASIPNVTTKLISGADVENPADATAITSAAQADSVYLYATIDGLTYTDGEISYKIVQTAPDATIEDVENVAGVNAEGIATILEPINTYALGANAITVTVTNTYQLDKKANASESVDLEVSGKTIGTADELIALAAQVNDGDNFENRTVTLTADIDMAGKTFSPIGDANKTQFKGEIDGGGHTINNLTIADQDYAGLVGYANGAKIHDLEVAGSISGSLFAAGIVAYANNVEVSRVANHAAVSQTVGSNYSSGAGGIFGYATTASKVSQSYNDGAITGKTRVGGIVGYGNAVTVADCYNLGTITNTGTANQYDNGTGGIVGNTSSSTYGDPAVIITNAYNAGTVVPPAGATRSYGSIAYAQVASDSTTYPTCSNVFYLEGTSDVSIGRNLSNSYDATSTYADLVKPLTTATLPAAFTTLGDKWQQAPTNYHDGYPALSWETVPAASLVTFGFADNPVPDNVHLTLTVGEKTVTPVAQGDDTYTALLPNGTYSYTAEAFGYTTQTDDFTVESQARTVTIPAFTASAKQSVTFTVVDEENDPIDSPTIVVKNAEDTVMEGEYATEAGYSLPDGTYSYTVSARGYVAKSGTITVNGATVSETVALQVLPAAWDGDLKSEPLQQDDVYQIGHAAELAWLAQEVNAGNLTAPVSAILTADIDLNSKPWTPIGTADKPFVGSFDGQGYSIQNIASITTTGNYGIFANVGSATTASEIKNVTVDGAFTVSGNYAFGGLVGEMVNTTVSNCGSSVDISNAPDSNKGAGGLIGLISSGGTSSVTACCFDGLIDGGGSSGGDGSNLGGIVGFNANAGTIIDSCYSAGFTNKMYHYAGGIIGNAGATTTVKNTYSLHKFGKKGSNAGILAGYGASNYTFENCYYVVGDSLTTAAVNGSSYGTQPDDPTGVSKLDSAAGLNAADLSESFVSKPWVNDGVPVLTWEKTPNAAKVTFTATSFPDDTEITLAKGEGDSITAVKGDNAFEAYIVETAQGEYTYTAKAFGYKTKSATVEVAAEDVTVSLGEFEEAPKQAVTFSVSDSEGTALAAGSYTVVVMNAAGTVQTANSDGTYSLPAATDYAYGISARGYTPAVDTFDIAEVTTTGTTIGATLEKLPVAWDGENSYEPETDAQGVYQIGTPYELAWLAKQVNAGAFEEPVSAVLTADIDLNSKPWISIGNADHPFVGTFDGQAHAVSGLSMTAATNGDYLGLFGKVGNISELTTLKSFTVSGELNANAQKIYIGGIAAAISNTTIENCGSNINLTKLDDGMPGAGGVVGAVLEGGTSSVKASYSTGDIASKQNNYGEFFGGIVGKNLAEGLTIDSCYAVHEYGTMYDSIGGIIGASSTTATVSNCYAASTYTTAGRSWGTKKIGAIGGDASSSTFTNCYYIVPDGSKVTAAVSDADAPGVTKVDSAADITAEKLGDAFQDGRVFAPGAATLAWEPLPEKLALNAEGLTISIADVSHKGTPFVSAEYNGNAFELDSSQATVSYYTDEGLTQEAPTPFAVGPVYAKIVATEDGDFTGELNTVSFNATNTAPALAEGVESSATATQFVGLDWTVELEKIFVDADDDTMTYTVSVDGAAPVATEASYSVATPETGTKTLVFTASDPFAAGATYTVTLSQREVQKVTIDYTVELKNAFAFAPQFGAEVTNDEAEKYGLADKVEGVSALDALVVAHKKKYGEAFTPETVDDYITINEYDYLTRFFGTRNANCGFAVNGEAPIDKTKPTSQSAAYEGQDYYGLSFLEAQLNDSDFVEFFEYSSSYVMDYYAWFADDAGERMDEATIETGEEFTLNAKGYWYSWYGQAVDESRRSGNALVDEGLCEDLPIVSIGEDGVASALDPAAAFDEDGAATVSFSKPGTYILAIQGDAYTDIISSIIKVTVLARPTLAEGVEAAVSAKQFAGLDYELDLTEIFADEDSDSLTYTVSVNGEAEQEAAESYSFKTPETGVTRLVFKAKDSDELVSNDTYTVELTQREETSAKVDFTSQMTGAYLHAPQFGVDVSNRKAEDYGYSDKVEGVSALDVLVAAHELVFAEDFTPQTAEDYLVIGRYGSPSKQFGIEPITSSGYFSTTTFSGGFFVNNALPNDGTKYDEDNYNGTTVCTQPVADGDLVDFFFFESEYYGDTYTWFTDADGAYAREFDAVAGEDLNLVLKGFFAMNASLFKDAAEMAASDRASVVDGAQLYTVDLGTGALTAVEGAVTDEGEVALNLAEPGEYWVTAYDGESTFNPILTLTKVNVKARPQLAEGVEAAVGAETATGQAYEVDLGAIFADADNDELSYTVSVDGAEAVSAEAAFSYTPEELGTTTFVFKASDGELDSTDTYTVTLTAKEPVTANVTVSISKYGELVQGKDGNLVAQLPVELTGKLTYTIDDALRAAHEAAYEGGAAEGYATAMTQWGLGLSKLWGDTSGNFAYQVNYGDAEVMGVTDAIPDGAAIDAYILESWYPDTENYSAFDKATATVKTGEPLELTLSDFSYDESFKMVKAPVEGAAVHVAGAAAPEGAPTTDAEGKASISFDEPGTYVVTAAKTKVVGGAEVTAITAPVCVVTVIQKPLATAVDKEVLDLRADMAADYADRIVASADGTDVSETQLWVPVDAKQALDEAITAAKKAVKEATYVEELDASKDALAEALETAKAAAKPGTKEAVDKAAADQAAAAEVKALIDALPAADQATADNAEAAAAAKAAYDALTDDQKALIEGTDVAKMNDVKAAADADAAAKAAAAEQAAAKQAAASELGEALQAAKSANVVDASDEAKADLAQAIQAAEAALANDAATAADLASVKDALNTALGAAEAQQAAADEQAAIDAAVKAALDKAAAAAVQAKIDALPTATEATADNAEAAAAAKAAYDALTDEQKALIEGT